MLKVEGYGIVFGRAVRLEQAREGESLNAGLWEFATKSSFVGAVRGHSEVELQIQHDGEVVAAKSTGSLRLGLDSYGLRFSASIEDTDIGRMVQHLLVTGTDRCSVGMDVGRTLFQMTGTDMPTQQIVRAHLDHIALVGSGAAAYPTAAWIADAPLARAPLHVRRAAAWWDRGAGQAAGLAAAFERVARKAAAREAADVPGCHAGLETFDQLAARVRGIAALVGGRDPLLGLL